MPKVTTVGELRAVLATWPDETTVFIDALDKDEYPDDYEWHFPIIDEPSESEREYMKDGSDTYVTMVMDTKVIGC
jgi:hypothetical protein